MYFRAWQAFGGFTSGIGVHYEPSTLSAPQHQVAASKLIVGEGLISHVFVRATDGRPYELQDLLPSDTRFKILVFVLTGLAATRARH